MMVQSIKNSTPAHTTLLYCQLSLPSRINPLPHTTNHRSSTNSSLQRRLRRFQAKTHKPHPMQSVDSQTTLQPVVFKPYNARGTQQAGQKEENNFQNHRHHLRSISPASANRENSWVPPLVFGRNDV